MVNELNYRSKKGCFISRFRAIIGLLIALLILLSVGLLAGLTGRSMCSGNVQVDVVNDNSKLYIYNRTKNKTSPQSIAINYRLPKSLKPLNYVLILQPFLTPPNFTFNGSVKIELKCLKATNRIKLHSFNLRIPNESILLSVKNFSEVAPRWVGLTQDRETHFFTIFLNTHLKVDYVYALELKFEGLLEQNLKGFYLSSFQNAQGEKSWLATSFFPPADARSAFPCFDEPEMKAVFNIVIVHRNEQVALSNMPVQRSEIRTDGWVVDYFQPTPLMSSYLVAFFIGEHFNKISFVDKSINNRQFNIWAQEDRLDQANFSLAEGYRMLTFFEDYFNMTYVLNKIDMVALPEMGVSAMENWGLITYRETFLLHNNEEGRPTKLPLISFVIGHELAHQWFGNLVTHKWWNDLWLKEGFASFMSTVVSDNLHKEWDLSDHFVCDDLLAILQEDTLWTSHPISVSVNNPDDIYQIYDGITYIKGQALIRMMEFFLGKETFRKGLDNYVKKYQYKNAEQDDLWQEFTEVAIQHGKVEINVKRIMDTWTLQMGYPLITVIRNYQSRSITLTQSHFTPFNSSSITTSSSPYGYKWIIPLSYTFEPYPEWENSRITWLNLQTGLSIVDNVPLSKDWVIFNTQLKGFYRVNYDKTNWLLISQQLKTDFRKIHRLNRAQILDDALSLASFGSLDYATAFTIISYLVNETDYIPWKSVIRKFEFLDKMFSGSRFYKPFKAFFRHLISKIYYSVGWIEDKNNSDIQTIIFREVLINTACFIGEVHCLSNAKRLFSLWKSNPESNPIFSGMKKAVYCTAIKYGDEDDWEFAFNEYLESNVEDHRTILLKALCCTKEFWLLNRLLELGLEFKEIKKHDLSLVVEEISRNPIGKSLAWNFLRENINFLQEEFQGGFSGLPWMFETVISDFVSKVELDEVNNFMKSLSNNLGVLESSFKKGIEKATIKINWRSQYQTSAGKWLENFENEFSAF